MKNTNVFLIIAIILSMFGFFSRKYFFKTWSSYYEDKLYKEPRPLLIKVLDIFNSSLFKEKKALDLGAGVGNDTVYLLQNGWTVWANDKEEEAINILEARSDIQVYKNKLKLIKSDFNALPWDTLPTFNLVYAGYSLPFLNKNDFYKIWKKLINQLEPNGLIAVHLFGYNHQGFNAWEKSKMTFFTREETIELLSNLEIKSFEEKCEKNDRNIINHTFSIIAGRR